MINQMRGVFFFFSLFKLTFSTHVCTHFHTETAMGIRLHADNEYVDAVYR